MSVLSVGAVNQRNRYSRDRDFSFMRSLFRESQKMQVIGRGKELYRKPRGKDRR
jgi:hypothetical protein